MMYKIWHLYIPQPQFGAVIGTARNYVGTVRTPGYERHAVGMLVECFIWA